MGRCINLVCEAGLHSSRAPAGAPDAGSQHSSDELLLSGLLVLKESLATILEYCEGAQTYLQAVVQDLFCFHVLVGVFAADRELDATFLYAVGSVANLYILCKVGCAVSSSFTNIGNPAISKCNILWYSYMPPAWSLGQCFDTLWACGAPARR